MNIFKKIARVISNLMFYFLLAIIVLLIVYILVINYYKKQDRLGEIPLNFYTILTTSMVPKIDAGDIIITFKKANNIYKKGDVITFISDGAMTKGVTITHRIINVENRNNDYFYYTKGDANNTPDSAPVPSKNVVGKVVFKIPKAGYIQQFLVSKFGWLVAVVLPCMAIIIYDIVKIFEKIFKVKLINKSLSLKNTKDKRVILEEKLKEEEEIEILHETLDESSNNLITEEKGNDSDVEIL